MRFLDRKRGKNETAKIKQYFSRFALSGYADAFGRAVGRLAVG
jgi:hypothetical protein